MKAAVCRALGQLAVEELDEPSPREGEVALELVATGVCGTDLSIFRGHMPSPLPIVLGHEGVGVVRELGPGVAGLAPGDPVVCTIIPSCGRCFYCARGEDPLCEEIVFYTGRMLDGTTRLSRQGEPIHSLSYQASFAERAIVPERCAVRVRREAPLEHLVGLACGVSTGLGASMLRAPVEPGSSVLVIGAGGVGLAALMGARLRGAGLLVAADLVPARLERARALGLAHHTIDPSREPLAERVRALCGGVGALVDAWYRLDELPRAFDDLAHGRVTRGAIRF